MNLLLNILPLFPKTTLHTHTHTHTPLRLKNTHTHTPNRKTPLNHFEPQLLPLLLSAANARQPINQSTDTDTKTDTDVRCNHEYRSNESKNIYTT